MNEEEDSNNIIINEINNINVAIEKNDMILAERLCKHVIVLNENSNNIKVKIQLLTIFKILIKLLILNNELNEASKYAEQCLCNTALLLGGYHIDTANAMTLVASILKKGNREQQEEAEYIYSQAIEIYKANSDNSLLASTIMNMAMTIEAQGELRLHDAIQYYYDALQMKRKIYGEKHSETGDSLLCLASCLARSGNNLEAAARYEQAYSVYKELRKNNEQAQTRLELCKKSLSTLLKKKSDELLKENKITEASVVHTASELGVIGDSIANGNFYHLVENILSFGKFKKSLFAAIYPIDKEDNVSKLLIWSYNDDNKSIVKYLMSKSSFGSFIGRNNLPNCEIIEIKSNNELTIDIDSSSNNNNNNNDEYLKIKSIDQEEKIIFSAWIPIENHTELDNWRDAFTL